MSRTLRPAKHITWSPGYDETTHIVPQPKPASAYLPEWYRKKSAFDGGKMKVENSVITNRSVKLCVPYADAMTAGYIQETWCDLYIDSDDGEHITKIETSRGPELVSHRDKVNVRIPNYVYKTEMVWKQPWQPIMPKGWSMLYTHPLNRIELPFVSMSGVIDADEFYHGPNGNYPFFIQKGFRGVIPAGTPMFQMIPIKRESWKSSAETFDLPVMLQRRAVVGSKFWGAYRKKFHVPKEYE